MATQAVRHVYADGGRVTVDNHVHGDHTSIGELVESQIINIILINIVIEIEQVY